MLSIQEFTEDDFAKIQTIPKAVRIYFLFFLFCIPLAFLLGAFGLLKKGYGYWPTTLGFLCVFFLVLLWLTLKEVFFYLKDMERKQKYAGAVTVISKSGKKGEPTVYLDDTNLKKLTLYQDGTFEQINEGDVLNLEISRYSKFLFRLEKEGANLLQTANKVLPK
ncbi:hypothetical protein HRG84_23340 [Flavisolibacter sp. BT320]|nr:hypothetical protein [Flavisolibacter longurius]